MSTFDLTSSLLLIDVHSCTAFLTFHACNVTLTLWSVLVGMEALHPREMMWAVTLSD